MFVEGELVIVDEGKEPTACPQGEVRLTNQLTKELRVDEVEAFDNGQVLVEAVLPGIYDLQYSCSGYTPSAEQVTIEVSDDGPPTFQRWEFQSALSIGGKLVRADGEKLSTREWGGSWGGSWITAVQKLSDSDDPRGHRGNTANEVDEDGHFKIKGLQPGEYELTVNSEDLPTPKEPTLVKLSGRSIVDLVIELPDGGRVHGTVRDADGKPIRNAIIAMESREEHWAWGERQTRTDEEGHYKIEDLRVGKYRVVASKGNWWGSETMRAPGKNDDDLRGEAVTVSVGGDYQVNLVVESQSGSIRGKVVDADGGPIADAFLSVNRNSDAAGANDESSQAEVRWGEWNQQPVLTDADGRFVVEGLSEGEYTVLAHRKTGGEGTATKVKVGSDITITIHETGEVSGQVLISGGGTPDRVSVSLIDESRWLFFSDPVFREDGRFHLAEIPAGNYELVANSPTGRTSQKLTLKAAEKKSGIKLQLSKKVTVHGKLIDFDSGKPIPGYQVMIQPWSGGDFNFDDRGGKRKDVSSSSGDFEVDGVASGVSMMMIVPRDWSENGDYEMSDRATTIPASSSVYDMGEVKMFKRRRKRSEAAGDAGFEIQDFPPSIQPRDVRFVVSHVRPGGPAHKAGLKAGDEILSIDGQDVRGENYYRYMHLMDAPIGAVLSFGLSNERLIKIQFEAKP